MLKTKDRNLALLVGRALDAQKFFHDVNYEHRLRDSPNELYQFREFVNPYQRTDSAEQEEDDGEDGKSTVIFMGRSDNEDDHIPHGVFTLLTDCYSPTCSRENLCYSVFCPRRLEQVNIYLFSIFVTSFRVLTILSFILFVFLCSKKNSKRNLDELAVDHL